MKFQYTPPKNTPVSSETLIIDMQTVAKKLNTKKLSQKLYAEHGNYNWSTIHRRFGSWNNALIKAGLKVSNIVNFSDENLFKNILNIWQKKGLQPTRRDMNDKVSKISSGAYNRRFNSSKENLFNIQIMDQANKLILFQSKKIRRIWHKNEWFYSVVDIVEALTDSPSPRQYWGVLKSRENQLLTICLQLKLESSDGKKYATDCGDF